MIVVLKDGIKTIDSIEPTVRYYSRITVYIVYFE